MNQLGKTASFGSLTRGNGFQRPNLARFGAGPVRSSVSVVSGGNGLGTMGLPPAPVPPMGAEMPMSAKDRLGGRSDSLSRPAHLTSNAMKAGESISLTDAVNAGNVVQPWAPSGGVGPGTRGYRGSFGGQPQQGVEQPEEGMTANVPFRTGRPDSEIPGGMRRITSQIRPLAPTFRAHGGPVPIGKSVVIGDAQEDGKPNPELVTSSERGLEVFPLKDMPRKSRTAILSSKMPKLADGTTKAPVSRAGRTGGMSGFYRDNTRLNMERGARAAIDPVTGLSQSPTEREIAALIEMLLQKPAEFPGYGGLEEAMMIADYYTAKKSGNPQALAQAVGAVQGYKDKLGALRAQQAAPVAPQATSAPPPPVTPQTVQAPPTTPLAPVPTGPDGFPVEDVDVPPELMEAQDPAPVASVPQVLPPPPNAGRTASLSTPYGKASATYGPRTVAPRFNWSDTYDRHFDRSPQMLAADEFQAVEEPSAAQIAVDKFEPATQLSPLYSRTGPGVGFEAVTGPPGRTSTLSKKELARGGPNEAGSPFSSAMSPFRGVGKALGNLATKAITKAYPKGALQ